MKMLIVAELMLMMMTMMRQHSKLLLHLAYLERAMGVTTSPSQDSSMFPKTAVQHLMQVFAELKQMTIPSLALRSDVVAAIGDEVVREI